jgi:hypothetical protein
MQYACSSIEIELKTKEIGELELYFVPPVVSICVSQINA